MKCSWDHLKLHFHGQQMDQMVLVNGLDRVYRLMIETGKLSDENDHSLDRVYHQTVKKVTDDFEKLGFNTAISQMMIFINECYKAESIYVEYAKGFAKMFACFAPHMGEEIWSTVFGGCGTITYEPWPTYDEAKLVEDVIEVIVQVNGKLKCTIKLAVDADKQTAIDTAMAEEKVQHAIEGKQIVKQIVVPGKIVNLVVK